MASIGYGLLDIQMVTPHTAQVRGPEHPPGPLPRGRRRGRSSKAPTRGARSRGEPPAPPDYHSRPPAPPAPRAGRWAPRTQELSFMDAGIVVLPNVGKSTLFNALTDSSALRSHLPLRHHRAQRRRRRGARSPARHDPSFIDTQKIIPAALHLVDIAGLVAGIQGRRPGQQVPRPHPQRRRDPARRCRSLHRSTGRRGDHARFRHGRSDPRYRGHRDGVDPRGPGDRGRRCPKAERAAKGRDREAVAPVRGAPEGAAGAG